jgi:beta-N-acetylhexosaminidase
MVYLRGLQGTGCLGCLKHFPGIGAGEVDTHDEMAVVNLSHDDLIAQDLAPYIELFQREDDRVRAVMVSHGGFPNVDIRKGTASGRLLPASVSPAISTKLLRQELGYKHLVITDDLEMGAISRLYQIEEAVLRAFKAGQDMFLICSRPEIIKRGYTALLQAARDGVIKQERINHSLRNIAEFKTLTQPPLKFDRARFQHLSDEIAALNHKLSYTYGGTI